MYSAAFNPKVAAIGIHRQQEALYKLEKIMQRGNLSRLADGWEGSPTSEELRLQRIPGYKGHQPGLISEGIVGQSEAKCSAKSISLKINMAKREST